MPLADVNGIQLYYEIHGEGEPLLFIMGTGQSHARWSKQLPAFRERYQCILFDNRGTGQSTATESGHTMRQYAEDAADLLDHLGISSVHTFGWSLGSAVIQELAINHPDKVRSLGLLATWTRPYPFFVRRMNVQIRIAQLNDMHFQGEFSVLHLFNSDFIDDHDDKVQEFQRRGLEGKDRCSLDTLVAQFQMDIDHDTADRLNQIKAPTLVLGGAEDVLVRRRYQEEVHRLIPHSKIVLIEGADHMAFDSIPDQINQEELDFLESLEPMPLT